MALFLIFLASLFVSFSNLCMRRSIDKGGTAQGFLFFQMGAAFLVAVFANPIRTGSYEINLPIVMFGAGVGLLFAAMLFSLGKALEKGPPGLTFSIINAATVVPGVVMALLFGAAMGFPYTAWHGIGSLLVLAGLFWAGRGLGGVRDKPRWIAFSLAMFAFHALFLILFQYRALLLNLPHPEELISFFTSEEIASQWFTPSMLFTAAIVQLLLFAVFEARRPNSGEVFYGVLGGIANGFCTCLMVASTEVATPLENAIIFPLFSVVTILLSNIWGQRLYQEKVNWRACHLCAFGLVVGTVDWKGVAAAIGF